MARHDNKASRQGGARQERRRILVYCGGTRTEPAYFEGLRRSPLGGSVVVEVRQRGVSPERLVRAASGFARRSPRDYEQIWCVVDVDEFDVVTAERVAAGSGISLAVSNPCFELWLLLHHGDCTSHCNGCSNVIQRLKRHLPDYDKTALTFKHFEGGVTEAIARAKSLDASGEGPGRNPSTSVWRLVETIVGNDE